jgi:hypothetical protein
VIFHAMLASFRVVFGGARARVTPYHLSRLYFWNSSISHAKSVFGLWRQAHRGMRTFCKACICCCRIFIYANFQVGTGPKRTYRAALLYFVLRHHYQTLIFFLHARIRQVVIIGARARAAPYRLFLVDLELDDLTCVVVVVDLRTDASGACRDVLVHQQSGDRDLNMKSTS